MTTLAQIRKVAKDSFIESMSERGFLEHKKSKLFFFRKNQDDIFQIIDFEILRGGENLRIGVYCWVPEFHKNYDMEMFPKGLYLNNGGYLLKDRVDIGSRFWDVRIIDDLPEILSDILISIDQIAIPWFEKISTRSSLIEIIEYEVKSRENFPEIKKEILNKVRS